MLGAFPTLRTTPAQSRNNLSNGTFCPLVISRSRLHSRRACVYEPKYLRICRRVTVVIFINSKMLGARPSFSAHAAIWSIISCFVMAQPPASSCCLQIKKPPVSGGPVSKVLVRLRFFPMTRDVGDDPIPAIPFFRSPDHVRSPDSLCVLRGLILGF